MHERMDDTSMCVVLPLRAYYRETHLDTQRQAEGSKA